MSLKLPYIRTAKVGLNTIILYRYVDMQLFVQVFPQADPDKGGKSQRD